MFAICGPVFPEPARGFPCRVGQRHGSGCERWLVYVTPEHQSSIRQHLEPCARAVGEIRTWQSLWTCEDPITPSFSQCLVDAAVARNMLCGRPGSHAVQCRHSDMRGVRIERPDEEVASGTWRRATWHARPVTREPALYVGSSGGWSPPMAPPDRAIDVVAELPAAIDWYLGKLHLGTSRSDVKKRDSASGFFGALLVGQYDFISPLATFIHSVRKRR